MSHLFSPQQIHAIAGQVRVACGYLLYPSVVVAVVSLWPDTELPSRWLIMTGVKIHLARCAIKKWGWESFITYSVWFISHRNNFPHIISMTVHFHTNISLTSIFLSIISQHPSHISLILKASLFLLLHYTPFLLSLLYVALLVTPPPTPIPWYFLFHLFPSWQGTHTQHTETQTYRLLGDTATMFVCFIPFQLE